MTDHLEQLLEEQERERDETAEFQWETGPVRLPRPKQPGGEESAAGPGGEPGPGPGEDVPAANSGRAAQKDWSPRRWAAGNAGMVQAGPRLAEEPEMGRTERQAEGQTAETADLRTAVPAETGAPPRADGGALWLDRAVRDSLVGLPRTEGEGRMVTLEPGGGDRGTRPLELRQLDRLVRRDARRFDGGFQLL